MKPVIELDNLTRKSEDVMDEEEHNKSRNGWGKVKGWPAGDKGWSQSKLGSTHPEAAIHAEVREQAGVSEVTGFFCFLSKSTATLTFLTFYLLLILILLLFSLF